MNELELKYGCNPNQKPSRIFMKDGSDLPIKVLNGKPGYISFLDAFNSWQLVKELKAADPEGHGCARFFWEYPATAGLGHFLHTYVCDGNPVIPTFQGEPERVAIEGNIDAFTAQLWNSLNPDNKISLFVRFTDLETRAYQQRILNKYQ